MYLASTAYNSKREPNVLPALVSPHAVTGIAAAC